jgi:polar amino acid transport system substrate-binding protein
MAFSRGGVLAILPVLIVACGGAGASPTPAASPTGVASATPSAAAGATATPSSAASPSDSASPAGAVCDNLPADVEGDLLATICERGTIRVGTDSNYAPQSSVNADGEFEGFDIDVANAIGERLGVDVEIQAVVFDAVVAGGWNGRWDLSVGSVTITEPRQEILDFTQPYYYTPAQMSVTDDSGITSLDALAGQPICVGSSTTYQQWIEGTLALVGSPEPATPPEGATAFPLETDQLCAQAIASGRDDFEAFLSSSTTVQAAIDAETPIVTVGDPVFYEALAVAVDKSDEDHDALLAALDDIVGAMHEDGTLSAASMEWFSGLDLTVTD